MSMTLLVVLLMAGWCTVSVCVLGWLYWLTVLTAASHAAAHSLTWLI